jgi:hypothetical protein
MTLNDELTIIDETLAELEGRRVEIINHMKIVTERVDHRGNLEIIPFPKHDVQVATYSVPRHVW